MELVQQLDDFGKPAWITLMILGFIVFWPLGLTILGYMIWSGRMRCGNHVKRQNRMWHGMCGKASRHESRRNESSGNSAFDEYRTDTLKRLEDEFEAFQEFLEQLRMAKDKEEFDNFMTSREQTGDDPSAPVVGQ
jgi:hypothetical protein